MAEPRFAGIRWWAVLAVAVLVSCSSGTDASTTPTTTTSEQPSAPAGSEGCGTEPDALPLGPDRPGDVEQTFGDRTYRIGVPEAYDPDVPATLVFNLHGSGSNALQASAYGDVPRAATERGMITVAPDAIGGQWQLGADGTDAEFLVALLDDVEARYCIDLDRVHMVGMSLGAWKTAATACAEPGRFASIALVTVEVFPGTCEPMPVIAFHGTADSTVPYGEGADEGVEVTGFNAGLPGAIDNIDEWAASGGCSADPIDETIGDDVTLRSFDECDPGVDVQLYTIAGGGHTWPGSDIDIKDPSQTTDTIDATALVLDFFEAHPR